MSIMNCPTDKTATNRFKEKSFFIFDSKGKTTGGKTIIGFRHCPIVLGNSIGARETCCDLQQLTLF